MTRRELNEAIKVAQANVAVAQKALDDFESLAENNVYASMEEAGVLEEILAGRAFEDCEGSYNCGSPIYEQEFMVDGIVYVATLEVKYNRHDKTYYYIDSREFKIEPKVPPMKK